MNYLQESLSNVLYSNNNDPMKNSFYALNDTSLIPSPLFTLSTLNKLLMNIKRITKINIFFKFKTFLKKEFSRPQSLMIIYLIMTTL